MGFGTKLADRQMITSLPPGLLGVRATHHINGFEAVCICRRIAVRINDPFVFLPVFVGIDEADLECMGKIEKLLAPRIAVGIAGRYMKNRNSLRDIPHDRMLAVPQSIAGACMGRYFPQCLDDRSPFHNCVKSPAWIAVGIEFVTAISPDFDRIKINPLVRNELVVSPAA